MNFMKSSLSNKIGFGALAIGLGSFIIQQTTYDVDGGQRVIMFDRIRGVSEKIRGEGLHFYIPWLQHPIVFDVTTRPKVITTETGSKDLQTCNLQLRVLFRPDLTRLKNIYQTLGENYHQKVLPSIGNEVLKAVVAEYDAGELITKRETVSQNIRERLIKRARDFGILLDDVALTDLTFSREYTKAIESKQVAQQQAEEKIFVVERAKREMEAQIILAEAETESARLIADAMKSGNEFLQLRQIEAAKEIAHKLSRSRGVVYLPNNGNVLLNLPQN